MVKRELPGYTTRHAKDRGNRLTPRFVAQLASGGQVDYSSEG